MTNSRPDILTRPIFLFGVGLLLLNDFYLKYEYSNMLTGKLSDFVGLLIFPYFFSSFQINWSKAIYISTVGLFIYWKSAYSQELIEWSQSIGIGLNRTIDYSDLIALIILPISYKNFRAQLINKVNLDKAFTIPVMVISVFAFWATTLPRERVEVNVDTDKCYELSMSKTEMFNALTAGHGYSDTLEKNLQDSLFYLTFDINEHRAQIKALSIIKEIESTKTLICLDSILDVDITGQLFVGVDRDDINSFNSLTQKEFESYFEKNFIKPVLEGKARYLYYDNKEIYDKYQEK